MCLLQAAAALWSVISQPQKGSLFLNRSFKDLGLDVAQTLANDGVIASRGCVNLTLEV